MWHFARYGLDRFTDFLFVFYRAYEPVFNRDNLLGGQAQCN